MKSLLIISALLVCACLPNNLFSQWYPEHNIDKLPFEFSESEYYKIHKIKSREYRSYYYIKRNYARNYSEGKKNYDTNGLNMNLPPHKTIIEYTDSTVYLDSIIYRIDSNSRLVKMILIDRSHGPVDTNTYKYHYDENGNCIRIDYLWNNVLNTVIYYTYDIKERLVEKKRVDISEGPDSLNTVRVLFIFNGKWMDKIIRYKKGKQEILYEYKFDKTYNMLSEFRYKKPGKCVLERKWVYNDAGKIMYYEDHTHFDNHIYKHYNEYDDNGNLVFIYKYYLIENHKEDESFTEIKYNNRNLDIFRKEYDKSGNLIYRQYNEYEYYK